MKRHIKEVAKVNRHSHSIKRKLILYLVLFSSFITLLITIIQLFQEYREGLSKVKNQIVQIEKLSLTSVTENLWNLYQKQIQSQLEDLVQLPDVQYLEIQSGGEIKASTGIQSSDNIITKTLPLIYVRGDEEILIGQLLVVASLEGVYRDLFRHFVVILISNGLKTALVSLFIFLIFQYLITRHLLKISKHLQDLTADHLDTKLELNRHPTQDELSQVVMAINEMGSSLSRTTISKNYLDNIIASMADGLIVTDPDTTIRMINKRTQDVLEYEEQELIGEFVQVIFESEPKEFLDRSNLQPAGRGAAEILEAKCLSKTGKKIPTLLTISSIRDKDNEVQGIVYVIHDMTERLRIEEELFAEKERAQVTLRSIGDAVISTDPQGHVDFLNPIAEVLTGWPEREAKGRLLTDVFQVVDEKGRKPVDDPVGRCLNEDKIVGLADDFLLLSRSGIKYSIEDSVAPIRGKDDRVLGVVLVFKDVTAARQLSRQLTYQATHDTLTGLINRGEFERRLQRVLDTAHRESTKNALCYLDLDQFKLVNDTSGHMAGDELLRQLGGLLQQCIRKRDTLARLGGDEFGLLMEHCSIEEAKRVAENIIKAIGDFIFLWEEHKFNIGVSIGLVAVDSESRGIQDVFRHVDTACYVAKEQGRNRFHLHQDDDEDLVKHHGEMQWAVRLPRALAEERFKLYFQRMVPIGADNNNQTDRYEFLLRMQDEAGKIVLPHVFLAAAERYNLSSKLDCWVINQAFSWFRDHPSHLEKLNTCFINLSGLSLSNKKFLPLVIQELESSGIPPGKICFEITETVAVANLANATTFIKTLRQLGCRFAIDDFGSGFSSFAYLKNLPVDFLKIDGLFVKDILHDPMDLALVKSINEIGHVMGKQTIAEFVENDTILEKLREIGVDYAQGYGIGRPRPLNGLLKSENGLVVSKDLDRKLLIKEIISVEEINED
jgi:diguanylate cyclase (GGDEF)-like protein/PAS domain S-box-containing protein